MQPRALLLAAVLGCIVLGTTAQSCNTTAFNTCVARLGTGSSCSYYSSYYACGTSTGCTSNTVAQCTSIAAQCPSACGSSGPVAPSPSAPGPAAVAASCNTITYGICMASLNPSQITSCASAQKALNCDISNGCSYFKSVCPYEVLALNCSINCNATNAVSAAPVAAAPSIVTLVAFAVLAFFGL
eukprot:TRINITY_DN6722_c0_g1_i1.p2 TRINITY_DN6722_c0_g1~~TRINITY_DN6722_c0_g1_i1.p2  ORF type:complete len:185 (+),score=31.05 TRINITY_DN6722_c0_g1_i1:43-597(+)